MAWLNNDVTKIFFAELAEQYYTNLLNESVVVAHAQKMGDAGFMHHTNPVEETVINSALKSGRNQVLETLMNYKPAHLEGDGTDD